MTISGSGFGDTPRGAGRGVQGARGGYPESPVRRRRFITNHRQPVAGRWSMNRREWRRVPACESSARRICRRDADAPDEPDMRILTRLLLIWLPVGLGLLLVLTGLIRGNALLIIAGLASAGVSGFLGWLLKSGWRAQDEARPKR